MQLRTPAGDVVLAYSGEAYDFVELRQELRRAGERFKTSSDTEVVLRGYLRWGETLASFRSLASQIANAYMPFSRSWS
jgi:asparagine synthase (glutamine-hydrolysing)